MAYPVISSPYGLKPVNEFGGLVYAGSTRMYPIATGYSTNLFNGDTVKLSNGTIVIDNYSSASSPTAAIAGTIGVFLDTCGDCYFLFVAIYFRFLVFLGLRYISVLSWLLI